MGYNATFYTYGAKEHGRLTKVTLDEIYKRLLFDDISYTIFVDKTTENVFRVQKFQTVINIEQKYSSEFLRMASIDYAGGIISQVTATVTTQNLITYFTKLIKGKTEETAPMQRTEYTMQLKQFSHLKIERVMNETAAAVVVIETNESSAKLVIVRPEFAERFKGNNVPILGDEKLSDRWGYHSYDLVDNSAELMQLSVVNRKYRANVTNLSLAELEQQIAVAKKYLERVTVTVHAF